MPKWCIYTLPTPTSYKNYLTPRTKKKKNFFIYISVLWIFIVFIFNFFSAVCYCLLVLLLFFRFLISFFFIIIFCLWFFCEFQSTYKEQILYYTHIFILCGSIHCRYVHLFTFISSTTAQIQTSTHISSNTITNKIFSISNFYLFFFFINTYWIELCTMFASIWCLYSRSHTYTKHVYAIFTTWHHHPFPPLIITLSSSLLSTSNCTQFFIIKPNSEKFNAWKFWFFASSKLLCLYIHDERKNICFWTDI